MVGPTHSDVENIFVFESIGERQGKEELFLLTLVDLTRSIFFMTEHPVTASGDSIRPAEEIVAVVLLS